MIKSSSSPFRALLACMVVCSFSALAAPSLRVSVNQHGDFVMIGNTLGYECAAGTPAPIVGTVACTDTVGNTNDSSPDLFWRSDVPAAGQASAVSTNTAAQARSTATLTIPAGATITHAYLYWAASTSTAVGADTTVTLERAGTGGFASTVTANGSYTSVNNSYASWADVTSIVQTNGVGAYRVSGLNALEFFQLNNNNAFAGWSLVVFYTLSSDPLRNLTLFDGLDPVSNGNPQTISLTGFLVPNSGFTGRLGVLAFEGDNAITGDQMFFNGGAALSDAQNSITNFFNGTRTTLGAAVSVAGDLPQLTGTAQSYAGMDLDIIDVTSKLTAGQTSATVQASSTGDVFFLAAFVTSISTFRPDFSGFTKTVALANGTTALPGSELEYTLSVTNSGNDVAISSVVNDPLPMGVSFVPGSIQVVSGANAGQKTDASGDDEAEYNAASRTLTVRVGTGANGSQGGELPVGGSTSIKFRVRIDAGFSGNLANQANIAAAGQLGSPSATTGSDGVTGTGGAQPTIIVVDACETNAQCGGATPYCVTASTPNVCVTCLDNSQCSGATPSCDPTTNTCVACAGDTSCTTATTPACQMSGACAECSSSNATLCAGTKPVCVTSMGFCGCNADVDCGGTMSGMLCEGAVCQAGCGIGRNDCAADQWCDVRDGGIGACIEQCAGDSDCNSQLSHCDVGAVPAFCVECSNDSQCPATAVCSPAKTCVECTATNTTLCSATMNGSACLGSNTCGCVSDADCGDATSGRICDATMNKCTVGCRDMNGNGCPAMQMCSAGTCVAIVIDAGVEMDAGVEVDAGMAIDAGVEIDAGMATGGGSGATGGGTGTGGGVASTGGGSAIEEPMGGGGGEMTPPSGCGCATGGEASLLFAAFGLLLARRRRSV